MRRILLRLTLCMAIVSVLSLTALAQGRGRGGGQGRRAEVFADRDFRGNRGRNMDWKCGKFVNCHDARDGRWDGRGPRRGGFWRDGVFFGRGPNGEYRRRHVTNDNWRRPRQTNYGTRYGQVWRYR